MIGQMVFSPNEVVMTDLFISYAHPEALTRERLYIECRFGIRRCLFTSDDRPVAQSLTLVVVTHRGEAKAKAKMA
jgi:hypothetical protein